MEIEILTKQDLASFKIDLIREIKELLQGPKVENKAWMRSLEVRQLLKISSGTLQNLRTNGIVKYQKIGGIFYYANKDIISLLPKTDGL